MRHLYRVIAIIVIATFALVGCQKPDSHDSHGNAISLSGYHDKWVIINYWATWCKPCLTELPELNHLANSHSDNIAVLGVSFDGLDNQAINTFSQSLNLTFPMLSHFPLERIDVKQIPSLPVTVIINPQGKKVATLYGPQTKQTLLAKLSMEP